MNTAMSLHVKKMTKKLLGIAKSDCRLRHGSALCGNRALRSTMYLLLTLLAIVLFDSEYLRAQFETGGSYIGPHFGLGSYESSVSLGGDFEYGFTKPGEAGSGRIGLGVSVDYWQWDGGGTGQYYWSYTWIPIDFYGAYHFPLADSKWDLFAGLGLGYIIVNSTWHEPDGSQIRQTSASYNSGLHWNGVAGARYFFSPTFAAQARIGWGASVLALGVNFKL